MRLTSKLMSYTSGHMPISVPCLKKPLTLQTSSGVLLNVYMFCLASCPWLLEIVTVLHLSILIFTMKYLMSGPWTTVVSASLLVTRLLTASTIEVGDYIMERSVVSIELSVVEQYKIQMYTFKFQLETHYTFFSSPEHKVLRVSYCDRPLSVVRRRPSCVVRRP